MSLSTGADPTLDLVRGGVLVVGEALIDVVTRGGGSAAHPGGSPLNVAVGLARLGLPALLHTAIGSDGHGDLIRSHLDDSGVRLSAESVTDAPTSVAEARIDERGAAEYTFQIEWDPRALPDAGAFAVVHTGSIATVLAPGRDAVRDIVEGLRDRATVSFDPNVRPKLSGSREDALRLVLDLVRLSDVVKASDEDVEWLYPGRDLGEVAREWRELGPSIVIVTRGGEGALAVTRDHAVEVPAPATALVDTVGAGDSFMAATIAALDARSLTGAHRRDALASIDRATLVEVVEFAARCAAVTVSRAGANPPWRDEVATAASEGRGFVLTRTVDAPTDEVFRAWTEPARLGWFHSGLAPATVPIEVDLRVGGEWRQQMTVGDGTDYITGGVYREISAPRRLAFSWGAVGGWPKLDPADPLSGPSVTVRLVDEGSGTTMTLAVEFTAGFTPEQVGECRSGWEQTIGRLVDSFGR
jgi:fructokinase